MAFKIDCDCGRTHEVTATMAGTSHLCRACGREMTIPLLSQLRALAGQERYVTNAAEKVAKLLRDDYVPPGEKCVACGCATKQVLESQVVCEKVWRQEKLSQRSWAALILVGLFLPCGWIWTLFVGLRDLERDSRERGHNVIVSTPIRLCVNCIDRGAVSNTARLRMLLVRVPQYAELFKEYPEAELVYGANTSQLSGYDKL